MSGYPVILGGDHAEFEQEWAASGRPDSERPDWPLPSFDARDWAVAFCRIATELGYRDRDGGPVDVDWMVGWFASALMRGLDEARNRVPEPTARGDMIAEQVRVWYETHRESWWDRHKFWPFAMSGPDRTGEHADEFMLRLVATVLTAAEHSTQNEG
jgi:hypothetical protein